MINRSQTQTRNRWRRWWSIGCDYSTEKKKNIKKNRSHKHTYNLMLEHLPIWLATHFYLFNWLWLHFMFAFFFFCVLLFSRLLVTKMKNNFSGLSCVAHGTRIRARSPTFCIRSCFEVYFGRYTSLPITIQTIKYTWIKWKPKNEIISK